MIEQARLWGGALKFFYSSQVLSAAIKKAGSFTSHRPRPHENWHSAVKSNNDYLKSFKQYSLQITVPLKSAVVQGRSVRVQAVPVHLVCYSYIIVIHIVRCLLFSSAELGFFLFTKI
jgi:hypothetical protein